MAETKPSILIVEDEPTLNEAYITLLKQAGYTAKSAHNGAEALSVLEQEEPDIIFLDLRMPVMDGIEFLKNYRPRENHPNVEIIVFSNYDMQKEVDEAYTLGAHRYILKAWASPKEFLRIIEDTLAAKNSSQPPSL